MPTPSTYENIQQVPCVTDFSSRDADIASDSYMKNCYIEVDGQTSYAVKRPGLATGVSLATAPTFGPSFTDFKAQGLAVDDYWSDMLVIMDDIYRIQSTSGALSTAIPSPTVPLAPYIIQSLRNSLSPGIALLQAFELYSTSGGITNITPAFIAGFDYIVPSLSILNSTYYLWTLSGKLYSTTNYNSWNALNFLLVDDTVGSPVRMIRHLTYLLTFSTRGIIAYYDAGVSPGSPLLPVPNAVFREGVPVDAAWTITRTINDEAIWVGQSASGGFCVFLMAGLSIKEISTPAVNRVLEKYLKLIGTANGGSSFPYGRNVIMRGLTFQAAGHSFYLVTIPAFTASGTAVPGITLMYDLKVGSWSIWTQTVSGNEVEWQPKYVTIWPGADYPVLLSDGVNNLQTVSQDTYQDLGQAINLQVQTDLFNWGNQRRKFIPATYLQADTLNSTVNVSWTDDDYTTFNTPQAVPTSNTKKQLLRCGSTTQRGWLLTHTDNTPMRLYGLEVEVTPGAL